MEGEREKEKVCNTAIIKELGKHVLTYVPTVLVIMLD